MNLRKQRGIGWLVLSALLIALDQWSKWFVLQHLLPTDVVTWTPFFNIRLAFNTGASYGLFANASGWQTTFFSLMAIITTIILIIWLARLRITEYGLCLALSLIIGGAVGNLVDRLRLSYVIDFFDFHIGNWHFATFNIADSCITIGIMLLLWQLCVNSEKDKNGS